MADKDDKDKQEQVYKCTVCGFETKDRRQWDVHIWICG